MDRSTLKFLSICRKNELQLTNHQLEKLTEYVKLLRDWNTKVNLISRTGDADIWLSHILHSVSPLLLFRIPEGLNALDLGTGGGLPGIPISIMRPDLHILLLDSIKKKVLAVQDILEHLSLPNVKVISARAEDLPKAGFANQFDIVLARAVAPLVELLVWSRPVFRYRSDSPLQRDPEDLPLPCLLAYKGGDLTQEITTARRKVPESFINAREIVFDGSEEMDLLGKKIVVATFSEPTNLLLHAR